MSKAKELIVGRCNWSAALDAHRDPVPAEFIRDNPNASEPGRYTDPKRGGAGGFLDHGIHYADTLRFLLGTEPVQAFGKVANLTDHRIEVDDLFIYCSFMFILDGWRPKRMAFSKRIGI